MDISRTPPKSMLGVDPTSLSMSTDNNDIIKKVITMFKNSIPITNENIEEQQLLKHPDYIALKDKEKKDLLKLIKSSEDDGLAAYITCNNCSYFEKLSSRTLVLNKISKNTSSINEVNDYSQYKHMRYDNTLPHTRDYICKNKDCKSHKDSTLKDAKWFRPNKNSYDCFYVCCECGVVWKIA